MKAAEGDYLPRGEGEGIGRGIWDGTIIGGSGCLAYLDVAQEVVPIFAREFLAFAVEFRVQGVGPHVGVARIAYHGCHVVDAVVAEFFEGGFHCCSRSKQMIGLAWSVESGPRDLGSCWVCGVVLSGESC